jgi:hypothetical protein
VLFNDKNAPAGFSMTSLQITPGRVIEHLFLNKAEIEAIKNRFLAVLE